MGFLDKVKAQATQLASAAQEKIEDVQADRKADELFEALGKWVYAKHTDRGGDEADAEIARLIGDLQAHEAEHGRFDEKAAAEATAVAEGSPPPAPSGPPPGPPPAQPTPPASVTDAPPPAPAVPPSAPPEAPPASSFPPAAPPPSEPPPSGPPPSSIPPQTF